MTETVQSATAASAHGRPARIQRPPACRRLRLTVDGVVQGVGFRPFVHRLAGELALVGWVGNTPQGVMIEVEGPAARLDEFARRLRCDAPPLADVRRVAARRVRPRGQRSFEIRDSRTAGALTTLVLPDAATCSLCLAEILDPANRRFRYPFTNCTHCGPRYSIIESMPYDRPNTTMRAFAMCAACRAEYDDPADRRFHAQPNACPECGPRLQLWNAAGDVLAERDDALRAAAGDIRRGAIVAVKGIGGFLLIVDARSDAAVARLRARKLREAKPLALMMPTLDAVAAACELSDDEARLLRSPAAPIVLLRRRTSPVGPAVAPSVAPGNPYLGVMLPYSPLHHLLILELYHDAQSGASHQNPARKCGGLPVASAVGSETGRRQIAQGDIGFPVVATSGNRSDEPICTDEREALRRLAGIADSLLVHDRPIARAVDDSVARVALGEPLILRRARGYAPLPAASLDVSAPVLAVGAHLKNTVAIAAAGHVVVSQHIGDLETREAFEAFERAAAALQDLQQVRPKIVACDLHPDYASSQFARRISAAPIGVQHHHAHVAACMAEHDLHGEVLGVCWDGTGYGPDGTIWGGEFLRATRGAFRRVASLKTFALPGGEAAVREPRRSALGVLYETFGPAAEAMDDLPPLRAFAPRERRVLFRMMEREINSPRTSSMGRLFDAVAAVLGLRQTAAFEGQAAMDLEFAAGDGGSDPIAAYPCENTQRHCESDARAHQPEALAKKSRIAVSPRESVIAGASGWYHAMPSTLSVVVPDTIFDWTPMICAIVADLRDGVPSAEIARRFHRTLIVMVLAAANGAGLKDIVLTGGCFQNMLLLNGTVSALRGAGFRPFWPQRVPMNDGGISLGQAVVALSQPAGED